MCAAAHRDLKLEIAHVLFLDIVAYSNRATDEQVELVELLNDAVEDSSEIQAARAGRELIELPTGDGMALVFRNSPEGPARAAIELAHRFRAAGLQVRMGIHSGPVNTVNDSAARAIVAGAGINLAQRVMDCGDNGHILFSRRAAEDLQQHRRWQPLLHELGRFEVKHGVRLDLFNFYAEDFGNPQPPDKLRRGFKRKIRTLFQSPQWVETAGMKPRAATVPDDAFSTSTDNHRPFVVGSRLWPLIGAFGILSVITATAVWRNSVPDRADTVVVAPSAAVATPVASPAIAPVEETAQTPEEPPRAEEVTTAGTPRAFARRPGEPAQQWIGEFVRQFVRTNGTNDVDLAVSFYAPQADILGEGRKDRAAIRRDIADYNARWPGRMNQVREPIDIKELTPDHDYAASFQQTFQVENLARRERILGVAAVDLRINIIDGVPCIVSIKEKTMEQRKDKL